MSEKNDARENRIYTEPLADAYDSEERAMGWYYYLADKITFPFTAECIAVDKRIPLELKEQVTVTEMSGADHCEHDIYVDISWKGKALAIPLSHVQPLKADDDTVEAIGDWHYWVNQGHEF